MGSRYSILASDRPAKHIDRNGMSETHATVYVADAELKAIYALMENSELINLAPFGNNISTPLYVYGVYTDESINILKEVDCVFDDEIVSVSANCEDVQLTTEQTLGSSLTGIHITYKENYTFIQPLIVWYPIEDSIRLDIPDKVLNLISDCNDTVYQSSPIKVYSRFSTGEENSPEVEVTESALNGLVSSDPTTATVSNGSVTGVTVGDVIISIENIPSISVTVVVSSENVSLFGIYATVFSSLTVTSSESSYTYDSIITATASYSDNFTHIDTTGYVAAYIYFEDGARLDVKPEDLLIVSADDSIVEANTGSTFLTKSKGETELKISWRPSCISKTFVNTTRNVKVTPPSFVSLTINIDDRKLADEKDNLNFPASTIYSVIASFSDSSTVDVTNQVVVTTEDGLCHEPDIPGLISVCDGADAGAGKLNVTFTYSSAVKITESIDVIIIELSDIDAKVSHYAAESETPSKSVILSQFGSTGIWEIAYIEVTAIYSDGSNETVPLAYSSFPAGLTIDIETGKVTTTGTGTGNVEVVYRGSVDIVTFEVNDESLTIKSLNVTLEDTESRVEKSVIVKAEMSDGTIITDLSQIDPTLPDLLVNFTVTPENVAQIDSNVLTIVDNHHSHCTLEVQSKDGGSSAMTTFIANSEAEILGQIDLGYEEGFAQPPVTAGTTFTTDVRINRGNVPVFAMEVTLQYDPDFLRVVSVDNLFTGNTEIRTRSPEGTIKISSALLQSFGDEEVPTVAQIEWEALEEGEVSIVPTFILADDGLTNHASDSNSLPILVTNSSMSKRSIHTIMKRNSLIHGDINKDSNQDILDVASLIQSLSGKYPFPSLSDGDINFDQNINVFDVVYLLRASAGLIPFLTQLPTVTPVSYDSTCLLTLSATVHHTSESNVFLFFVLSSNITDFDNLLTVSDVVKGFENSVMKTSGIFEGTLENSSFTASLFTPINYKQGEIGLSTLILTTDELSETSPSRFASFLGNSQAKVSVENIKDFTLSSSVGTATLDSIWLGEGDNLYSLTNFTNFNRSDYCDFDDKDITTPSITEDHPLNTTFYSISVFRDGWPADVQITYSIVEDDVPFEIANAYTGSLVVSGTLDYDSGETEYTFSVVAGDAEIPLIIGTASVTVPITDVNDNAPEFNQSLYEVSVYENHAILSVVITVFAQDNDATDENNELTYVISSESDPDGLFSIDETNGIISLAKSLDREIADRHELTILAIDTGSTPLTGTATVDVTVLDINDNEPMFSQDHFEIEIPEDFYDEEGSAGSGGKIFTKSSVDVTDLDFGENMIISLSLNLLSGEDTYFDITDDGYIIVLMNLDRETLDRYDFNITAKDGGSPARTSYATLTIIVTDVNDNNPIFLPGEREFLIEDDLNIGTVITTVSATDADIGVNKLLEFSIEELNVEDKVFDINPITGDIFVNKVLYVEEGIPRKIIVTVTDKGSPPLKSETNVTITIIEGPIIAFDVGNHGYLVDEYIKNEDNSYTQKIGYLFGEELGNEVQVSGRIGTAFSRDFENIDLVVQGGRPSYLNGVVMQERVHHSLRTVTVLIQAFDDRKGIARPILTRVQITPHASLATLHNDNPVSYCTTSNLGYCVAQVTLPNQWFERNTSNVEKDRVSIQLDVATETGISEQLGDLYVESSPTHASGFLSDEKLAVISPSHTLYVGNAFSLEIYVQSPLKSDNFYTKLTADVASDVVLDGYTFDSQWSCQTSGGNTHFECDVLIDSDLTTNSILKLGDIQFHIPEDYPGSSASIAFNNIQLLAGNNVIDTSSKQIFVDIEAKAAQYLAITSRRPELVNTAHLNGLPVFSTIYYITFDNDINVLDLSENSYPGNDLATPDIDCSIEGTGDALKLTPNCLAVSVDQSLTGNGQVLVSFSSPQSSLTLLNTNISYHVWMPIDINLNVSDDKLSPVEGWKQGDSCFDSPDSYQTSRFTVEGTFSDGTTNFSANILSLVNTKVVSSDTNVATINTALNLIRVYGTGQSNISLPRQDKGVWDYREISVLSTAPLSHIRLDPVVASLRLVVKSNPDSRLTPNTVSMEILSGIFYLLEQTEVTISIILSDGHRLLIEDPNEIALESSNTSVVTVDGNHVIAHAVGVTNLNVSWIVCGEILLTKTVEVNVSFDQHRPTFDPVKGNATVPEDTAAGYLIYTVFATDEDSIDVHSDDIRYNIKDDPYVGLFVIDEESGEITLNGKLDRESVEIYKIEIEATDRVQRNQLECIENLNTQTESPGGTTGSGSGAVDVLVPEIPIGNISCPPVSPISVFTLTIFVGDINDNVPICPDDIPTIYILNDTQPNTIIGSIIVSDADTGVNAKITYELFDSVNKETSFFDINATTGEIYTIAEPSIRTVHYLPIIQARDGGNLTTQCNLLIEVYRFYDTVTIVLTGSVDDFNAEVFAQLLSEILNYEIEVASIIDHVKNFTLHIYALDSQNLILDPDILQRLLRNLTDSEKDIIEQAGFSVIYDSIVSNKPTVEPPEVEIDRKIPPWAVAVIVVLNSTIVIALLLLIVGILWRRLIRMREEERRQNLNKRTGLRSMESLYDDVDEGEMIEMGGINDPERGALIYQRKTQVKKTEGGQKRIKKITEETSWIGKQPSKKKMVLGDEYESDDEPPPPPIRENNPLYSPQEYITDFSNPIYRDPTRRKSRTEGITALGTESVEMDETIHLSPEEISKMGDEEVDIAEADTLF